MSARSPAPPRQVPPPMRPEGTRAAASSPYARFIPREEVEGASAWMFERFSDDEAPSPFAPQPAAAPEPPPPPEPTAEELMQAARQQGYQDGYRDGLAALEAFKQRHTQQMAAQMGALVAQFDNEFRQLEDEMAATLQRCAIELARQVVRGELVQQPELVARVAREAVAALTAGARQVRVRVHPSDFDLVQSGAGDALAAREALLLADPTVTAGGVQVDADLSSVDGSLPTRWQTACASLGQRSLWEERRGSATEATAS